MKQAKSFIAQEAKAVRTGRDSNGLEVIRVPANQVNTYLAAPELFCGLIQAVEVIDYGRGDISDSEMVAWIANLRSTIAKAVAA